MRNIFFGLEDDSFYPSYRMFFNLDDERAVFTGNTAKEKYTAVITKAENGYRIVIETRDTKLTFVKYRPDACGAVRIALDYLGR